jgi:hypothetical protein
MPTTGETEWHFTHGTAASTADAASEPVVKPDDRHIDAPHLRPAEPPKPNEKHDQLAAKEVVSEDRQEALFDEGLSRAATLCRSSASPDRGGRRSAPATRSQEQAPSPRASRRP